MKEQPKVIENDALVCLCLQSLEDSMTHHEFKVRAAARGFSLTKTDCHNMLHRSTGRTFVADDHRWKLTVHGHVYRQEVLDTIYRLLAMEAGATISIPP